MMQEGNTTASRRRRRAQDELASQAVSTSNGIIFKLLLISPSKLRTLEPAFSHMQVFGFRPDSGDIKALWLLYSKGRRKRD